MLLYWLAAQWKILLDPTRCVWLACDIFSLYRLIDRIYINVFGISKDFVDGFVVRVEGPEVVFILFLLGLHADELFGEIVVPCPILIKIIHVLPQLLLLSFDTLIQLVHHAVATTQFLYSSPQYSLGLQYNICNCVYRYFPFAGCL